MNKTEKSLCIDGISLHPIDDRKPKALHVIALTRHLPPAPKLIPR